MSARASFGFQAQPALLTLFVRGALFEHRSRDSLRLSLRSLVVQEEFAELS